MSVHTHLIKSGEVINIKKNFLGLILFLMRSIFRKISPFSNLTNIDAPNLTIYKRKSCLEKIFAEHPSSRLPPLCVMVGGGEGVG